MRSSLDKLTIQGFKSIRELKDFSLSNLNVLIGANGAGKSNFIGLFALLGAIVSHRLQLHVAKGGGAERFLHLGRKHSRAIEVRLHIGSIGYSAELAGTTDDRLVFESEHSWFHADEVWERYWGHGHKESAPLSPESPSTDDPELGVGRKICAAIVGCTVYHFHDTTETAAVRHRRSMRDNERLRSDGSNLAPFLLELRTREPQRFRQLRDTVRLVAPFIDDLKLRTIETPDVDDVLLEWTQPGSDYPFHPSQLSDGTLRFICLATALLQPNPPSTMLFDEPELGLHPQALEILAAMFKEAATQTQVIVSTQSAPLVSQFEPQDVIVVSRRDGASVFERLDAAALAGWLEDYTLGELWQKNVIAGGPVHE